METLLSTNGRQANYEETVTIQSQKDYDGMTNILLQWAEHTKHGLIHDDDDDTAKCR
jgi:hypothetical protein